MTEIKQWADYWNGVVGLLGLVLTVAGFSITLVGVYRARRAADLAKEAVQSATAALAHHEAIADLASATSVMDEIKRLQRQQAWAILPDRYGELRRRISTIRVSYASLLDTERQTLQASIEVLARLERKIEKAAAANGPPPNPAKLNEIVSGELDAIQSVLLRIQRSLRA
jgi:hypothetical protein